MTRRILLLGLAVAGAVAAAPPAPANATSTGIVGYSGKAGANLVCNACHSGGIAPDVVISGPPVVEAGAVATFRVTVTSNAGSQTGSGFNVAASAGTLTVVTAADTQKSGQELTHKQTKVNAGGQAFWDFKWQAPAGEAFYVLYASGNSVNRNQAQTGDQSASGTHIVQVGNPPTWTPTGTATGTRTRTPTRTRTFTSTATFTTTPSLTATANFTATASFTSTPGSTATPSFTAASTLTPTPAVTPTLSATAVPCFGDCDGDRLLTESDLERVRSTMLLCGSCAGDAPGGPASGCAAAPDGCPAADFDADDCLRAAELTRVINAILTGTACPGQ